MRQDAGTAIERAIRSMLPEARIGALRTRPWASATFTGARHQIELDAADSEAMRAWLATLPEVDFALRGHIVAEATLTGMVAANGRVSATIEMLSVEA